MRNTTSIKKTNLSEPIAIIIPSASTKAHLKKFNNVSNIALGNGKTLLEDQLEKIGHVFKKADYFYVCEDSPPQYFPAHLRIIKNQISQQTGVAHSIGLATLANLHKSALIVYGDLYFPEDCLRILEQTGLERNSCILTHESRKKEDVGVYSINNVVQNLYYGLSRRWTQIAYLTGRELVLFRQISNANLHKGRLTFEVFNEIIKEGGVFKEVQTDMDIWDVDRPEDVKRLKLIV